MKIDVFVRHEGLEGFGGFVVEPLEDRFKATRAEEFVRAFVGGKDGGAGFVGHRLDVDEITIVIVDDEHVGVAARRWVDKAAGEIAKDLAGGGGEVGVDVMCAHGRRRRADGKEVVEVVGVSVVGVSVVGVGVGKAVVVVAVGGGHGLECRLRVGGGVGGRVWQLHGLGRVEVGALLVEVPLNHGDRGWWVSADLGGGEGGPGGEVTRVDGSAPGRESWRKQRGVEESDAVGNGGRVGWEKSIGLEEGGPGGRDGRRWRCRVGGIENDGPQVRGRRAVTVEYADVVEGDSNGVVHERGHTSVVAQLAQRKERAGSKGGEDVGDSGGGR